MIIAIYGNIWQKHSLKGLLNYLTAAHDCGNLVVEQLFYDFLVPNIDGLPPMQPSRELPQDARLLISFGGDGTFLRAAQWADGSPVPIMGVNTGHLGYLSMFDIDRPEELQQVFGEDVRMEKRTVLEIKGEGIPSEVWPYALNEVSVLKNSNSSMVSVHASVDEIYLTDYLGDGLIVATATGSTGYNMSVGGPILQPDSRALILSPIAAHTLTMRPLIVDDIETVTLRTRTRAPKYTISLDGQAFDMPRDSEVTIRRAPFTVNVLRRRDDDFARTLRTKLLWGQR